NVFYQRGSISIVLRRVRVGSPTFEELGLPSVMKDLADLPRGLILVTGPTGAGKTTTLACMIEHINATRPCHILTIEEPIEVVHSDKVATINQREIGMATEIMVNNGRIADRIVDSRRTPEIADIIAEGGFYGMQTFDQHLLQMVKDDVVSVEDALVASSKPHDFTLMLEQAGIPVAPRAR